MIESSGGGLTRSYKAGGIWLPLDEARIHSVVFKNPVRMPSKNPMESIMREEEEKKEKKKEEEEEEKEKAIASCIISATAYGAYIDYLKKV